VTVLARRRDDREGRRRERGGRGPGARHGVARRRAPGARRPARPAGAHDHDEAPGADGPANLRDAVAVAAAADAGGLGAARVKLMACLGAGYTRVATAGAFAADDA
jgi:hypothetical protein